MPEPLVLPHMLSSHLSTVPPSDKDRGATTLPRTRPLPQSRMPRPSSLPRSWRNKDRSELERPPRQGPVPPHGAPGPYPMPRPLETYAGAQTIGMPQPGNPEPLPSPTIRGRLGQPMASRPAHQPYRGQKPTARLGKQTQVTRRGPRQCQGKVSLKTRL